MTFFQKIFILFLTSKKQIMNENYKMKGLGKKYRAIFYGQDTSQLAGFPYRRRKVRERRVGQLY